MTAVILLAVFIAIAGIAAAVFFARRASEAEARRQEQEAIVADWLEANTMLRSSAFESFRALFRAARHW